MGKFNFSEINNEFHGSIDFFSNGEIVRFKIRAANANVAPRQLSEHSQIKINFSGEMGLGYNELQTDQGLWKSDSLPVGKVVQPLCD